MAVISVQSPTTGATYTVQIGGDTPTPTEQERIGQYVSQQDAVRQSLLGAGAASAAPAEGEAPSTFGEVGRGLGRGFFGSLAAVPAGIGALGEAAYGKLTGQDVGIGETAIGGGLRDFSETLGSGVESLFGAPAETTSGQIGEAIGSIGSFLVPGGAGAAGARLLGGAARAQGLAAGAAGTTFGSALGADYQADQVGDAILSGEVVDPAAQQAAVLWGGLIGAGEMVVGGAAARVVGQTYRILNRVPPELREDAIATIGGRIRSALRTGGIEGAQEALSQIAQNVVSQQYYDPERVITEGAGESFGIGGAAGAAVDLALTSLRAPAVRRDIARRDQATLDQIETDLSEDRDDILRQIGAGLREEDFTPKQEAPSALALPAPEIAPTGAAAATAVPEAPEAISAAVRPSQRPAEVPERKTPFRWSQYEAAKQSITESGEVTVPAIQRAASTAGQPVTPAVAKRMRAQFQQEGLITPDAAAKGKFRVTPDQAKPVAMDESILRSIEDTQKDISDARTARVRAEQEARRAKQTGKRQDELRFLREVESSDQSIQTGERTVAELTGRLAQAPRAAAVPTTERPADTRVGQQVVMPIAAAPTEAQDFAITERSRRLTQAATNYERQGQEKLARARALAAEGRKVQLPKSEKDRMDRLRADAARDMAAAQKMRQVAARPPTEVQVSREQAAADRAKEAARVAAQSQRTPQYMEREKAVTDAMRQRLDQLGLKDIGLRTAPILETGEARTGNLIEGMFDSPDGKGVISLSVAAFDPKLSESEVLKRIASVVDHEIIHALRNLGVVSDTEWKSLSALAARQKYMRQKNGKAVERQYTYLQRAERMNAELDAEGQVEEAVAEMYRDFADGRLKIGGRPRSIMERIRDFFRAIIRSHKDIGITDPAQLFEAIKSGQVGARERAAVGGAEAGPRMSRASAETAKGRVDYQSWATGPNGEKAITDENGNPVVFYHGTSKDKDFTSFSVGKHGAWFTTDPDVASQYAVENDSMTMRQDGWNYEKINTASRVLPAFLRAANPFRGSMPQSVMAQNYKKSQSDWFDSLRAKGYDAWLPSDQPGLAVILTGPENIKSAYAGGADGKKDMRRFSARRQVLTPEDVREIERLSSDRAITRMDATGDTPDRISTRQPTTARSSENPLTQNLVVDLASMKASPAAFAHNMRLIKTYPGFVTDNTDPDGIAEDFIEFVSDNLTWLFQNVPAQIREQSKRWYDGARRITENWSGQFAVPDYTVAGVLAALSPQKDWYQNVSLGERVLDIHTSFTQGNLIAFTPTQEMAQTAARIYGGPKYAAALRRVLTTPYSSLGSELEQAMWLRIYDETYNPRGYRTVSAEGDFVGNADGNVAWGSNVEIGKAIYVLKSRSREATSEAMGGQHKVRNFYNNILAPNAPHGDVTIDTHAVAAALIRPLSGSSAEVLHNFGSSPMKNKQPEGWVAAKSVGDSGAKGTYGIYAEAYRRSADRLGVLPRELQSITWEAVRGLFPAVDKRNKGKVASVTAEWRKVSDGTSTDAEARENILAIMGGINEPTWYGPDSAVSGEGAPSSYEGELADVRLSREYGRSQSRASGRDAGGDRIPAGGAGVASGDVYGGGIRAAQGRTRPRYSARSAAIGDQDGRDGGTGDRGELRQQGRFLAPLEGSPRVRGASGPDQRLVDVAEKYARDNGIDLRRQAEYVRVDPDRATRIAEAYDRMENNPSDPKVRVAYEDMIRQTIAQYRALADAGYVFWFIDQNNDDGYLSSPWNAMRDIRANQSMGVFPTEAGYGSAETEISQDENPLLADTGIEWPYGSPSGPMKRVLANDLFRAVHDAFGHGIEGSGFRADGEENAWQAHIRLFTGPAQGAMTSETRGQNSWLNYGPYGESNRSAQVEDTVFAPQKIGVMPEWTWTEGRAADDVPYPSPESRRFSRRSTAGAMSPKTQKKVQSNQSALMYAKSADLIAKGLQLRGYGLSDEASKKVVDNILRKFQDSMLPVGRMVQELSAKGLTIVDAMDTYLQEEIMSRKTGAMIDRNTKDLYAPMVAAVKKLNVPSRMFDQLKRASTAAAGQKGFVERASEQYGSDKMAMAEAYLYARHAKERNKYILNNRDDQNTKGSGMSDAEADAILRWFENLDSGTKSVVAEIAKYARLIVANTNQTRVDGGLISRDVVNAEEGDVNQGTGYGYYVPLRGILSEDTASVDDAKYMPPATPLYGARGKEDRKALGRGEYASDILANLMTQNQNSIVRSERNKVGQSFLRLLRADPTLTSAYASILPTPPKSRETVNGKIRMMPKPDAYKDPDILVVKEDGKETFVRFDDVTLAGALNGKNGFGPETGGALLRGLSTVNRYLASINTSYNPAFIITNVFRDSITGLVNLNQFEIEGLSAEVAKNIIPSIRGIGAAIFRNDTTSPWAKVYADFVESGGQNATNSFDTLEERMNDLRGLLSDIPDAAGRGQWARMKNSFVGQKGASLLNTIESVNTAAENGIRVATYKALLDRGYSKQRAAQAAGNVTVNFSKGGDYRRLMNGAYLFYNASIQGTFAMLNAAARSGKVQKMWLGFIAAGAVMDMLNAMLSDEDEDGQLIYDKIQDHVLEHNIILPDLLGTGERSYISIPMPYGLNMAFNAGRAAMRGLRGTYTPSEAASTIFKTAVDTLNPIGSADNFLDPNTVAPTILDPIIDVVSNEDFAGRDIYKEGLAFDRTPDPASQLYWATTSPSARWITDNLNSLTGGSEVRPGAIDVSPDIVQFWFEYITGGVGRFILQSGESVARMATGEFGEEFIGGVPVFNRVVRTVSEREDMGAYIEGAERILTAEQELKRAREVGDEQWARRTMQRYEAELRLVGPIRSAESALRRLSRQRNELEDNPRMPEAQKKIMLDRIEERRQQVLARANALLATID